MNVGLIAAFVSALSWGYVYYNSDMATKIFPNPKVLFGGMLILIGSFIISKYQEIK